MKIDELVAVLGIEVEQQKLQNANAALKGITDKFFNIKTAVVAAALATFEFEKRISDSAVQMQNVSDNLGVGTDKFQELEFAASKAGIPIDNVTSAIARLNQQQEGVKVGIIPTQLWEMLARLQRLTGITINGYGKTGKQVFDEVGNAILHVKNKLDQAYISQQIFGSDLVPFFKQLKDANAELKREGWIVSDTDLERLKQTHEQIASIKQLFSFLATETAASLAPALSQFNQALIEFGKSGAIQLFKDLGTAIAFVAEVMGGALKTLLIILNVLGDLDKAIGDLFSGKLNIKNSFTYSASNQDFIQSVFSRGLPVSNSTQNTTNNNTSQNTTVNISNPFSLNTSYILNRTF